MSGSAAPRGWTLYRDLDAGKPDAARDFGARRDDGRARCFGIREPNGTPRSLRAEVTLPKVGAIMRPFPPDELAAACAWADEKVAALDAREKSSASSDAPPPRARKAPIPRACKCGAPFPFHLAKVGLTAHVCSCERSYKVVEGRFVESGREANPFATDGAR